MQIRALKKSIIQTRTCTVYKHLKPFELQCSVKGEVGIPRRALQQGWEYSKPCNTLSPRSKVVGKQRSYFHKVTSPLQLLELTRQPDV